MTQIWKGKTEYFDEIVDTFLSAGIKTEYDEKKWTISVADESYSYAYGMLCELNSLLQAGW
jgi:hypothetical protein